MDPTSQPTIARWAFAPPASPDAAAASPADPGPTAAPEPAGPFAAVTGVDELRSRTSARTDWLWQGYLARGSLTLLTSRWKSGKTTLASVLLARLHAGGELAGLPLAPGRAVVVTEEGLDQWRLRADRLGFGNHLTWFSRPFHGKPSHTAWLALLQQIARLHQRQRTDLLVIDPLASFLP